MLTWNVSYTIKVGPLFNSDTNKSAQALKTETCRNANFVVAGGTAGCHNDNLWCRQWYQSWYHYNSRFSVDDIHNSQQWKILWKPRMLITRRCRNLDGPYLFFGLPSAATQITATDTCVIDTHIKEFHYRHNAGSEQQSHQSAYFSWKR